MNVYIHIQNAELVMEYYKIVVTHNINVFPKRLNNVRIQNGDARNKHYIHVNLNSFNALPAFNNL